MAHLDFKKTLKDLYGATLKVRQVEAGPGAFLAVDGGGGPGGEAYHKAIQELYSIVYTLKFALKKGGVSDFVVPPLESLWHDSPQKVPDMSKWRWRALIRVPDTVMQNQVEEAKKSVLDKRGLDASDVKLIQWSEGDCLQVMHVGPYDQVGAVYAQLRDAARDLGVTLSGPGHEVYLSDPRRTTPEKLKTIVRMPIGKQRPS